MDGGYQSSAPLPRFLSRRMLNVVWMKARWSEGYSSSIAAWTAPTMAKCGSGAELELQGQIPVDLHDLEPKVCTAHLPYGTVKLPITVPGPERRRPLVSPAVALLLSR
jgi:hypothetical protein